MDLLEYGDRGRPLLAFPTSSGRFFDYENFGMVDALRHKLEQGEIHLFCVDSVDAESFYATWKHPADRIARHVQYESYLIEEVLPLIRSRNGVPYLAITGNSFGGYHTANFALRHPDLVDKAISLGGAFDMSSFFDGHYDDNVYYNSPLDFVPGIPGSSTNTTTTAGSFSAPANGTCAVARTSSWAACWRQKGSGTTCTCTRAWGTTGATGST
jgi:esterase/lipase superfamily enzyme